MTKTTNNLPPYLKLQLDLTKYIAGVKPGERLPSEPKLAAELGVSRSTLREVMRIFEGQGLIRRRQGVGTFVVSNEQSIDAGLEVLESIESMAHRTGQSVSMGVMHVTRRDATQEEAEALDVDENTSLVEVSRAILAGGRPVAYLIDRLPHNVLTPEELHSGFTGSVLDLLIRRGNPLLSNSKTEIRAVPATSEVARALEIQRGDVLLCFAATLYSADGAVVDYSHSYFLPGHFRFHVVRRIGTQTIS
jgi:GntR family transcriptional regulator